MEKGIRCLHNRARGFLPVRGACAMKKLLLISVIFLFLFGILTAPTEAGAEAIASRYPFKVGDRVCIRRSASVYTCRDGKWMLADERPADDVGVIASIQTVSLSFPNTVSVSFPRPVSIAFSNGVRSVKLYEIVSSYARTNSAWVDDIAPTISYGGQLIIYDAYQGEIHVNLKSSGVRKAVLQHALDIAKALRQAHESLGYGEYFRVDVEYFAWELIAHAYAAENGLPGYWDSSIADCNVFQMEDVTKAMIEVARILWRNGPKKTW